MTHAAASSAARDGHTDVDTPVWKAMLLLVASLVVLGTALTAISLGAASLFA